MMTSNARFAVLGTLILVLSAGAHPARVAASDPNSLASSVRSVVSQMDSELPLDRAMSMPALIDRQKGGNPFFVVVLGSFAVLALILASIGIYGLLAFSINRASPMAASIRSSIRGVGETVSLAAAIRARVRAGRPLSPTVGAGVRATTLIASRRSAL